MKVSFFLYLVFSTVAQAALYLGTNVDDVIQGGNGSDQIYLRNGADTGNGMAGDDLVFGESGTDILLGGDGKEIIGGPPMGKDLFEDISSTLGWMNAGMTQQDPNYKIALDRLNYLSNCSEHNEYRERKLIYVDRGFFNWGYSGPGPLTRVLNLASLLPFSRGLGGDFTGLAVTGASSFTSAAYMAKIYLVRGKKVRTCCDKSTGKAMKTETDFEFYVEEWVPFVQETI